MFHKITSLIPHKRKKLCTCSYCLFFAVLQPTIILKITFKSAQSFEQKDMTDIFSSINDSYKRVPTSINK